MKIKKVGVVGCGQMGGGIAQVSAQAGYEVIVSEINEELLQRGLSAINASLTRNAEKGRITAADKDATFSRIKGTTDLKDFNDCDLVIEAAIENMDLKKQIFANLDKVTPKHAILASNSSCLSIIDMAMETTKPELVLGMHFFNPVTVMKLIEIVKTIATSDETVKTCQEFCQAIGKTSIIAKDTPGFIVNTILMPFMLEAVRMLEDGVATAEDIDNGIRLGLNHPMGPLALIDLIGLDTVFNIASGIYEEFRAPRFAPPVLLKKMVIAGRFGRKSGWGFYKY